MQWEYIYIVFVIITRIQVYQSDGFYFVYSTNTESVGVHYSGIQ